MVPKGVPGQSLPLDQPYLNRELFSDNYLKNRLPESDLWAAEGLAECRAQIGALYEREVHLLPSYNEPQLEKHFIQPVLGLLGHCYEVQERETDQPDYAFFPDETARQAAHSKPEGQFWEEAVGLGDAKPWDANLDAKGKDSPFRQITHYLYHYGIDWGILTNGRLWRLYHRDRSRRKPVFYQVDLPWLLEDGNEEDFKCFYLFFRQRAFYDPPRQPFLDVISEEGTRYGAQLQEDLKGQVYQALRYACQGFLSYKLNGLTAADLNKIHDNALVLLYRLLFILYAEARGLLPMDNAQYRERYSVAAIKRQATGQLAATMTNYWPDVRNLCRAIDRGDEELGVPEYNGGLFDPQRYPFLEEKQLPDKHLAQVLDALARTADGAFLDYSDLEVRHLGSIYEGLLEYKLAQATESMVAVKRQGKELWIADAQAQSRSVVDHCQPGDLYLVTDRGERKATGSYYTPQYIVEYIVDNTVGPLVEECESAADVLQLNILDPAMGSGHFLVEATDYLARAIAEKRGENWEELTEEERIPFKRDVVERCIYGVDLNPLAVELAKLSLWLHTAARGRALNFLDHHLRWGNSLIGAKIEELAVPPEIGKKQATKKEEAGQAPVFDYGEFTRHATRMVQDFALLEDAPSETRVDVQYKGEILHQLDEAHRRPYREIGDLWCSRYFGNDYDGLRYNQVMGYLQRDPDGDLSRLSPEAQDVLAASRQIAQQRLFFHWEIEFPEVFFDEFGRRKEHPGFGAVIGNPPYGAELASDEIALCDQRILSDPNSNSSNYFMVLATGLCSEGSCGMIVPKSLTYSPGWRSIRAHVVRHNIRFLLDVTKAFRDVELEQVCVGWGQSEYTGRFRAGYGYEGQVVEWLVSESLATERRLLYWFSSTLEGMLRRILSVSTRFESVASSQRGPDICGHLRTSGEGVAIANGAAVHRYRVGQLPVVDAQFLEEDWSDLWKPPKLLAQEVVGRIGSPGRDGFRQISLNCVVDGEGLPFVTTVVGCKTHGALDEGCICACMNSTLYRYFLHRYLWNRAELTLHLGNQNIRNVPIRIIDFDHPTDEADKEEMLGLCREAIEKGDYQTGYELACKALTTHAALHGPAGKSELKEEPYWKEQIARADPGFPGREDFVHDLLAMLAQWMIDLNKEKHQLIDNFETDLRGAAAQELHEKLKKGKQGRSLYKHESCHAYVEEGSGTTHHLPETLSWSAEAFEDFLRELVGAVSNLTDFLEVYCRYTAQYRQVTDALEKTDHLIDQIVYALYGLTEEEIAVVEGQA